MPSTTLAIRLGNRPISESAVMDLPEPDCTDDRDRLIGPQLKSDPVDRVEVGPSDVQRCAEPTDLQDRLPGGFANLGSHLTAHISLAAREARQSVAQHRDTERPKRDREAREHRQPPSVRHVLQT